MKKNISIIVILIVTLFVLVISNPSEEKHKRYISNQMVESVEKKNPTTEINPFSELGKSLGIALVERMVTSDNYIIFSLGIITYKSKTRTITFGIAGQIIPLINFDEISTIK